MSVSPKYTLATLLAISNPLPRGYERLDDEHISVWVRDEPLVVFCEDSRHPPLRPENVDVQHATWMCPYCEGFFCTVHALNHYWLCQAELESEV